jgi:hypothetical protein
MPPNVQMELLRPLITPAIQKLALQRYRDSKKLIEGNRLTVRLQRHEVKTALLLVWIMNPFQKFSQEGGSIAARSNGQNVARPETAERASVSRLKASTKHLHEHQYSKPR